MINSGKVFERDFKESCEYCGIWCWRISDSYVTAKNIDANAFVPMQPADFLIKYGDKIWFVELKHTDKNYMTVQHDDVNGMIKKHQVDQMMRLSQEDVIGVLLLQFDEDTYALRVEDFCLCLERTGKHSINKVEACQYGTRIENKKIRTHMRYDIDKLVKI